MSDAAWKPDPTGRYELRYFDGRRWTDDVVNGNTQAIDPEGAPPSGDAVAAAEAGAFMQPTSRVTLWQGQKESLGTMATAGKVVTAKYRITEDTLIFEAGLVSTTEEIIPLWAVMDVDYKQSMTQKVRGLGDLVVRLDPAGGKYGQTSITLESIREPRNVRDLLGRQANVMRTAMLDYQHDREIQRRRASATNFTVGAQTPTPGPTPTSAPSGPDEIMAQIRKLGELRDDGILTDAEFDAKKSDLLSRL